MSHDWKTLEDEAPELAKYGRARLDGLVAYLATVQTGWPRIHPVTPVIGHGRCFIFVEPESSKARDLKDNGRYSLHCGMSDSSGSSGEFRLVGEAEPIRDETIRRDAEAVCSFRPSARSLLFELRLTEVVATSWRSGRADRRRWPAP